MLTTTEKFEVFKIFLSKRCPICKGPKNKNHWFCLICAELIHNSEAQQKLRACCDAHVQAVRDCIQYAKEHRNNLSNITDQQKTERIFNRRLIWR